MASSKAVAFALAMLKESFPSREITERTPAVWLEVFDDVPDKILTHAAITICRSPEQKFFPTTGELFAVIQAYAPKTLAPDADQLFLEIAKLGDYNPNVGWRYPRQSLVREKLGDAVAAAYGGAGGAACFSDNETTRSIARRQFAQELGIQIKTHGSPLLGNAALKALPGAAA